MGQARQACTGVKSAAVGEGALHRLSLASGAAVLALLIEVILVPVGLV